MSVNNLAVHPGRTALYQVFLYSHVIGGKNQFLLLLLLFSVCFSYQFVTPVLSVEYGPEYEHFRKGAGPTDQKLADDENPPRAREKEQNCGALRSRSRLRT